LKGSSDFAQLFFFKFGIDGGQQKMDTSDPSATYVSWNPGQKLELRIPISHFGNPRLTNQVCSINVLTLD
jgi:uncharacterized membrane protein